MKRIVCLFICLFVGSVNATVIVSTLPQTSSNATGVGFNDYAAGFVWNTDANFASADLYLDVIGSPADLVVSIFDDVSGSPGSSMATLSGVNPTTEGLYNFSNNINLTNGLTYWLVASLGTYNDHLNQYLWFDGTLGDAGYVGTKWRRGTPWDTSSIVVPAAFSVNATSVPEPATLALLTLGLAGIGFSRKKKSA